jgi:hypothetical protein
MFDPPRLNIAVVSEALRQRAYSLFSEPLRDYLSGSFFMPGRAQQIGHMKYLIK